MSDSTLKRTLKSRHLVMIALGGSIGTGLFLASGGAIYKAGPGGAMLAYVIISIMVYFLMSSLGEMSAHSPTTGTFCEYSSKYVSADFGFAMGWNYWFNWAITISTEVIAAAFIVQYWFPGIDMIIWSMLFFLLVFLINLMSVKIYGEVEYWLSSIKVAFIVFFVIVSLLAIIGVANFGNTVGFQNWQIGDAPFHNGFLGFMSVFLISGFSLQGTELVGVAAGEALNPKKSIPKAIKQTFWRLMVFYIFTIGVISFLIPYNSEELINQHSSVAVSPFTIILNNFGFKYVATIMNAVILIAVLSACNASMYSATRIIWHLSKTNQAPKILSKINSNGTPFNALLATALIGCFFFSSSFFGSGFVFLWLVNISSLSGFIAWFGIALSHYRFRRAYCKQGLIVDKLPYKAKLFPIAPMVAMVMIIIIILGQEFYSILTFQISWKKFFMTYIGFLFFLLLLLGYKLIKKSKVIPLTECDIVT